MAAVIERNSPPPPFLIEEDSVVWKGLSCVPLLGAIPALIQFSRLLIKTRQEAARPGGIRRCIELHKVGNDYMKASVVNGLLSTAIAVSLLYFGIFISIGAPLLSIGVTCVIGAQYVIYATKKHLEKLQPMMGEQEAQKRQLEALLRRAEDLHGQIKDQLRWRDDLRREGEDLARRKEELLIHLGHVVN